MTPHTDNTRAALLMVAAMAGFAVEDLFLKQATRVLPPGEILVLTGAAGAAIFAGLARLRGQPFLTRQALRGAALVRSASEALATLFYILALAWTPLSMTSALLQATPLAVVAGAALILGEKVGWRRWTSILAGFAGVLIILQPWDAQFDPYGLLTVACVVVLASRDLSTRAMPAHVGSFALAGWAYLGLVFAGSALMAGMGTPFVWPDATGWLWLAGALGTGLVAYYMVVACVRMGEVAVVAPYRYTRLVFAAILATVFLGEVLAPATLIGATIVVGSGVYAFARERARKRLSLRANEG